MSPSNNKEVCKRHYQEVLTGKHLDVIDEIYADEVVYRDGQRMPREQFKMIARVSTTAFPDLQLTIHEQVAERDLGVTRWTATGTHLGDFMRHGPTGRPVRTKTIHIDQIANHRICRLWEEIDLLSLSKQLGISIG